MKITIDQAVIDQALDAFENIRHHFDTDEYAYEVAVKSITALRQSIEQADLAQPFGYFRYDLRLDAWVHSLDRNQGVAFYTTPPQPKQVQKNNDRKQA
jgi:hypothetical protein